MAAEPAPVSAVDEYSSKPLPPTRSFCSVNADNLVVTALKKAELSGGLVLRAVEMDGTKAETQVEFLGRNRSFRRANLLEEETNASDEDRWRVSPLGIGTVRIMGFPAQGRSG